MNKVNRSIDEEIALIERYIATLEKEILRLRKIQADSLDAEPVISYSEF